MVPTSLLIALVAGLLAGALAGIFAGRVVAIKLARLADYPRSIPIFAGLAQAISIVPAYYLAFVVGGNFGGALGSRIGAIQICLALGIASVLAALQLMSAILGALVGLAADNVVSALKEPK